MVEAMEKTDYIGTMGRVQFYGKDSPYTHAVKVGEDYMAGVAIQWQNGKQVCIWPRNIKGCDSKLVFPSFVKLPKQPTG
jgi:branched-chain amino acid transport system substrate-binding protein